MCYAFTANMEADPGFPDTAQLLDGEAFVPIVWGVPALADMPNSLKRKASESLDSGAAKKVKCSSSAGAENEGSGDGEEEGSEVVSNSAAVVLEERESVGWLKVQLAQTAKALAKQKRMVAETAKELVEKEEEIDEWRLKAITLESEKKTWTEKIKRAHAEKVEAVKDISKNLKAEHEQKLQKAVQAKLELFKKRLEDFKANHFEQIDEAKDAADEKVRKMAAENKKVKAECKQLVADTKADCKEQVKNAKPETAKAVKEKDAEIKKLKEENTKLSNTSRKVEKLNGKLETEVDNLDQKQKDLHGCIDKLTSDRNTLQSALVSKTTELHSLAVSCANRELEIDQKLQNEGRRWQIQYDRAQETAVTADHHRRACFELRNANERKNGEIRDWKEAFKRSEEGEQVLRDNVERGRAECEELKKAVGTAEAGSGRPVSESGGLEAKEGEGGKEA